MAYRCHFCPRKTQTKNSYNGKLDAILWCIILSGFSAVIITALRNTVCAITVTPLFSSIPIKFPLCLLTLTVLS